MSQSAGQQPSQGSEAAEDPTEVESNLGALGTLRNQIVKAWQERGVIFTPEEQQQLRDEIKVTCTFLTDLTVSS